MLLLMALFFLLKPIQQEEYFYSDLTGANRETIIESVDFTGPKHRQYLNKPRIYKDQKYVVYQGNYVQNPNSYVIDAIDDTLIAIIGDSDAKQPMISPNWGPDGSLYVQGETSLNNGI